MWQVQVTSWIRVNNLPPMQTLCVHREESFLVTLSENLSKTTSSGHHWIFWVLVLQPTWTEAENVGHLFLTSLHDHLVPIQHYLNFNLNWENTITKFQNSQMWDYRLRIQVSLNLRKVKTIWLHDHGHNSTFNCTRKIQKDASKLQPKHSNKLQNKPQFHAPKKLTINFIVW